jgi:serine/threonine-protein kinase RsbW
MRRGGLTMGKNSRGETETVERFLDSTLESVDSAEELALQEAEKAGVAEDDLHKIAMAVRESMVNAVVHGNRYSAHKKVRLSVSKGPREFIVKIADEGEGFDYEHLPDPLAQENLLRHSGRGIFLIKAFMDDFQVRRLEPRGSEVTLVKYLVSK